MSRPLPVSRKFSAEQLDRALLELARCGGNAARASNQLKNAGISIHRGHLTRLRDTDRYRELRELHARDVENVIVAECRDTAVLAGEIERKAIEAQGEQLEAGETRDPSSVARNMAVLKGINVDKALLLQGRPTEIQRRDPLETLRTLERMGLQLVPKMPHAIDGTVEELE